MFRSAARSDSFFLRSSNGLSRRVTRKRCRSRPSRLGRLVDRQCGFGAWTSLRLETSSSLRLVRLIAKKRIRPVRRRRCTTASRCTPRDARPPSQGPSRRRDERKTMVTDVVGGARTYAIKGLQGAYVRCPRREYAHVRHGCRTADRTQRRPRPGCSHRVRGDGQRGLRAQRRTAVRLTVSEAGLDVAWIFGTYRRSW